MQSALCEVSRIPIFIQNGFVGACRFSEEEHDGSAVSQRVLAALDPAFRSPDTRRVSKGWTKKYPGYLVAEVTFPYRRAFPGAQREARFGPSLKSNFANSFSSGQLR